MCCTVVALHVKTCQVELENGASLVTRCIGLLSAYCTCELSSMHLRIVYYTVTVQYLLYCSVTLQHNSQRDSHPLCHTCPPLPAETSNPMESNWIGLRRKLFICMLSLTSHNYESQYDLDLDWMKLMGLPSLCSQSQLVTTLNDLNLDWMKLIN